MTLGKFASVAALCTGLAGCSAGGEPIVGDEPITTEAIAAVIVEHIDLQSVESHPYPALTNRTKPPFAPWPELAEGAWVYFTGVADALNGSVSLSVIVRPEPDTASPCEDITYACVDESVDGHEVSIAWIDHQPEEDPGIVRVIARDDGEEVDLLLMGPYITADPRELDLGVPLADLVDLVIDPRLSLTTSQEVVDLGDSVELSHP